MNSNTLVQKLWNFCHTLRDDGVGYGDYLEQLTYLLFLKLAHEYAQPPHSRDTYIPRSCDWNSLRSKNGEPLEAHYLKYFDYETLITRDKASLDIFWLKDDSLENLDDLPPPDVLAQEIVEHLEAALASFREVAAALPRSANTE
ncbi:MAG: type I restriction-modification system subunit M N-terminal domain-containing protein [Rhodanobacter sp.]